MIKSPPHFFTSAPEFVYSYRLTFGKLGAGIALCIEKALSQSGVAREDVNYVNAHATSTPSGDLKEYQALVRCFGSNPEVLLNHINVLIM